jgi:hypothetical protein
VTITATLAILNAVEGTPGVLEVFTFAAGAIAAFTLVEAVASRGFRRRLEDEPSVVEALGSAFAILSVGGCARHRVRHRTVVRPRHRVASRVVPLDRGLPALCRVRDRRGRKVEAKARREMRKCRFE